MITLRLIPLLLSCVTLMLATGASLRVPSHAMPWTIPAYLAAQCLCDLINFLNLHRAQNHEPQYVRCFAFLFAAGMVLGIAVTVVLVRPAFQGAWLWFSLAAAAYSLSWGAAVLHNLKPAGWLYVTVGYSVLMLCCGTLCAWAALANLQPALKIGAIVLGVRWQAQAVFGFAYSLGITKNFWLWFKLNHLVPSLITIVCALWLCIWYSGLRSESAKPLWAEVQHVEVRP